jgi:hypothetical protein
MAVGGRSQLVAPCPEQRQHKRAAKYRPDNCKRCLDREMKDVRRHHLDSDEQKQGDKRGL